MTDDALRTLTLCCLSPLYNGMICDRIQLKSCKCRRFQCHYLSFLADDKGFLTKKSIQMVYTKVGVVVNFWERLDGEHTFSYNINNKRKSGDQMADLKEIYNEKLISRLIHHIKASCPDFNQDSFEEQLLQEDWPELALKERMRRITVSLYETLPKRYNEALAILRDAAPHFKGLSGILFPDYVEQYGLAHWEESIKALEYFTQYSTSEFAVRPFCF